RRRPSASRCRNRCWSWRIESSNDRPPPRHPPRRTRLPPAPAVRARAAPPAPMAGLVGRARAHRRRDAAAGLPDRVPAVRAGLARECTPCQRRSDHRERVGANAVGGGAERGVGGGETRTFIPNDGRLVYLMANLPPAFLHLQGFVRNELRSISSLDQQ